MDVIKAQEKTYPKPTAMQSICWPVLLSDRDLIAVTNSNYGKHLAVSGDVFFFALTAVNAHSRSLSRAVHAAADRSRQSQICR